MEINVEILQLITRNPHKMNIVKKPKQHYHTLTLLCFTIKVYVSPQNLGNNRLGLSLTDIKNGGFQVSNKVSLFLTKKSIVTNVIAAKSRKLAEMFQIKIN